jgi:hypothetical protein
MRHSPPAPATARWIALAGVLVAGAAGAAMLLRPAGERGLIMGGAAYAIATYDLALPLVGIGIAMARMTGRQVVALAVILVAALSLGVLGEHRLLSDPEFPPRLARRFIYLGPLCCVIVGLALPMPSRLRLWLMAPATGLAGAALGFLAALHDPALGDPRFAGGAAAVGLWLVAVPPALLGWFSGSWLTIGGRIVASWLIAIGLLLGGSKVVVQRRAEQAQGPTQLFVQPPASIDPGAGDVTPAVPRPREWSDQSRQP